MSENVIMRNPHLFKVTLVFCSTKPPKLWNKNKCKIYWFKLRDTYSVRRCLNRLTRIRHGLDAGARDRSQGRALIRGWPVPVSSTKGTCHRDQQFAVCRSFLRSSSNLWILHKKNRMELLTFLKQNLSLVDLPLSGLFDPNVVSFSGSWNESDACKVVKSAYGIGNYFPLSWGFYRGDRRGN